jgi:hypothetical protein
MPVLESKKSAVKPRRETAKGPRVDEAIMEPGDYEVTPDTTFGIDLYLKRQGNRWIIQGGPGKDVQKETVTMRLWDYDEMVELRKMSTAYDASKRMHIVDHDVLNRLKAQKLFVSWTFQDRNKRIVLHKRQGAMTDESWEKFKKLSPNIIKYLFEKMNEVYEYNG